MPSQGPFFPSVVSQTNVGQPQRIAWDTPELVDASDNLRCTFATATPGAGATLLSWKIVATDFGFTIPENSQIDGIVMTVEKLFAPPLGSPGVYGDVYDGVAELYTDTVVGQNGGTFLWPTGNTDHSHDVGGTTDFWGWTGANSDDVNSDEFGIRYEVYAKNGNLPGIDSIRLTVYYTLRQFLSHTMTGGVGVGGGFPRLMRPQTHSGGVGVGAGAFPRKWKKVAFTGGAGVGGDAWTKVKGRLYVMGGGVGIGYGVPVRHYKFSMQGGVGIGGAFGVIQNSIIPMTGGVGVGGDSFARHVKVSMTGGVGVGGTSLFARLAYKTTTGGVGAGNPANALYARHRFRTVDGGVGVGESGAIGIIRAITKVPTGGVGIGGGFIAYGTLGGGGSGGTDWGFNREKRHRGPFTRWEILTAVKQYLETTVLDGYTVYVATDEPDMNGIPPADRFAVVMLGASRDDQGPITGGGLSSAIRTEPVHIRIYSNLSNDQYPRASAWTLRQDRGALERSRKIRKTLHMHDLMDLSGWLMLCQPMRSLSTGEPRAMRANPQWGYFQETFEAMYLEYLG